MDVQGVAGSPRITMPISVNYGSIHESSSRFKMQMGSSGSGQGLGNYGMMNSQASSIPAAAEEMNARPNTTFAVEGHPPPPAAAGALVKKAGKYKECLKNHAANIGGYALDGCGEFMPSGDEGSLEAFKCAACGCHRNFHRREVEGAPPCAVCGFNSARKVDRKRLALPGLPLQLPPPASPAAHVEGRDHHHPQYQHQPMATMMSPHLGPYAHTLSGSYSMKKRFRTKFSTEQKERMGAFAEKVGWKIQKHDEAEVQQFCADIGVRRHVLKVWMHNNKNVLGKKPLSTEVGTGYLDNGGSPTNSSGMHASDT